MFAAICHCSMCRRAGGAPAIAWAMFAEDQVEFPNEKPKTYASSPPAQRGFCPHCGTPISFTATFIPGLIDITIGSLDDPAAIQPSLHYWDSRPPAVDEVRRRPAGLPRAPTTRLINSA